MRIALPPIQAESRHDMVLAAMSYGHHLYELGASRSACRNQDEEAGWDEAASAAMQRPPLQEMIDFAAELQELQDDMDDRAFWGSGQW